MASRKIFLHYAIFLVFILLVSNHTVFHDQFGINLHLWVFQKAEIALADAARVISTFWKTHSWKLLAEKLNKPNYQYKQHKLSYS